MTAAAGAIMLMITVAACGSGNAAEPSKQDSAQTQVGLSAAQAFVAQYSKEPTQFPVDAQLSKTLKPDQKLVFLQCSAPFCALLAQLYGSAAKMLGTEVEVVQGGGTSSSLQSALASVQSMDPAAVLLAGVNVTSLAKALEPLSAAGVPIVSSAMQLDDEDHGIAHDVDARKAIQLSGQLLANWAISQTDGTGNIVWYSVPELQFSGVEADAFEAEIAANCPACKVRVVDIPVTTIGSTAPSLVVSDLQAHPDDKVALFGNLEAATGLPARLKSAGIDVKIAGYAPTPGNLQDIQKGDLDAAVALDALTLAFTQVDAAVRLATGQDLAPAEAPGMPVLQLVTKQNLEGDMSQGWLGYPDAIKRFQSVWQAVG